MSVYKNGAYMNSSFALTGCMSFRYYSKFYCDSVFPMGPKPWVFTMADVHYMNQCDVYSTVWLLEVSTLGYQAISSQ